MVIFSLMIIFLIVIVAAVVTIAEYKMLKKQEEKREKDADELTANYNLFLKEIKDICVEALQINDYRNCKEHYKEIISYIDKILK